MNVYFDNAATTPLDKEVIAAMLRVMEEEYGNPSSTHTHGRKVKAIIEEARRTVAKLMHCTPGEIFFTSGGTEADNMAIRKPVDCLGVKNIITSPVEHHAVLHTIEELEAQGKVKMHLVKLLSNGHIDLEDLERLLASNSNVLVSLMHGNNEIGNLLDLEKTGALCKQYGAYFHSDTVQTVGHYPIDLSKLNVHFINAGAHKFNGPKGAGFIYVNHESKIDPYITGGAQERNMRGGTENVYGIVGLARALEIACRDMEKDMKHIAGLKSYMISRLRETIPGVEFNGDAEGRSSATVLNVLFPKTPIAEMLLFKLDIAGVSASAGSACTSGSETGSHVLRALQVDQSRPCVRFSFGKQNSTNEVDYVVNLLAEMLKSKTEASVQ